MNLNFASLMEYAKPALLVILYTVAAKFLASAVAAGFDFFIVKLQEWGTKIDETRLGRLTRIDNFLFGLLINSATAVKAEFVDALKLASDDGKLTKEEMEMAKEKAYEVFRATLPPDFKKELISIAGEDFKAYVISKIPAAVEFIKSEASDPR